MLGGLRRSRASYSETVCLAPWSVTGRLLGWFDARVSDSQLKERA